MTALGILIAYIIYGLIVLTGLLLGWKIFTAKTIREKSLSVAGCISCFALVIFMFLSNKRMKKEAELRFVGTYHLTNYPNCDCCKAILKEDNSFAVVSCTKNENDKILEKGNWHYVAEGDFLGVSMDKDENHYLGSNRFKYSYYINNKGETINMPVKGP